MSHAASTTASIGRSAARSILVALAVSLAGINVASADVLAEFLFQQFMEDSGPGVLDHLSDYRAQRQLWKDKIAEGKAKLQRCGTCADRAAIEKELAYWQQTEAQFQRFAGAAFVALGTPPILAKFLGIDVPMAPHDPEALRRQYEVVRPEWVKDRPEYCQLAVDTHLQCLRNFQQRTGSPITDVAKTPGGACYDTRKLFLHCANKNYQLFQMEQNLQALRAAGKIIPEYVNTGQYLEVYYGPVPDDFVPWLPTDVVLRKFKEDRSSGIIRLTTRKKGVGVIGAVTIQSFFWNGVVPSSTCFSGQGPRTEIERRICDDLSTLSFKERPPILSCRYTEPGLMPSDPFAGSLYWYGSRAAHVEPQRLLSRAANHPVLTVGEPRTKCPLTRREAEQTKSEWVAKVGRLRTETPQIDERVALPESEWRKQQREEYKARHEGSQARQDATQAFPYEGIYAFETTTGGETTSGQCAVSYADAGANEYLLSCRHRSGEITARAGRPVLGSLQVRWQVGPRMVVITYQADRSDPNALVGADAHDKTTTGRLVRMRDLVRLADVPLSGSYSFEASMKGAAESGRCTITADERFRPPPFRFECTTNGGQRFSTIAQNRENAIFVGWPPLRGHPMHGLVFVIEADNAPRSPISLRGRNRDGTSVRLVMDGDPLGGPRPARPAAGTEERTSSGGGVRESSPEREQPGPVAGGPQDAVPSPTIARPAPEGGTSRQRCAVEQTAGTYQTVFGPLVCKPADGGLECCYGPRCERKAKLAFDDSGQKMVGTWSYPDGQHGQVAFPLSSQCALQSGRRGKSGQNLDRAWAVGRR